MSTLRLLTPSGTEVKAGESEGRHRREASVTFSIATVVGIGNIWTANHVHVVATIIYRDDPIEWFTKKDVGGAINPTLGSITCIDQFKPSYPFSIGLPGSGHPTVLSKDRDH